VTNTDFFLFVFPNYCFVSFLFSNLMETMGTGGSKVTKWAKGTVAAVRSGPDSSPVSPFPWNDLPEELQTAILTMVRLKDLAAFSQTSSASNTLASCDLVWTGQAARAGVTVPAELIEARGSVKAAVFAALSGKVERYSDWVVIQSYDKFTMINHSNSSGVRYVCLG
jgi:hypothetical protein